MEDSIEKTMEIFQRIDKIDQESKQAVIDYLDQCIELWEEVKDEKTTLDRISRSESAIWTLKHVKKVLRESGRMFERIKNLDFIFEHWGEDREI